MSAAPLHRLCLVLFLGAAAGCYEPNLADCALTCESNSDCFGGQVCSAQRLCAGTAVSCGQQPGGDAGVDQDAAFRVDAAHPVDAPPQVDAPRQVDARTPTDDAPPDAAPMVTLHLHDDGKGRITTNLGFTCDSADPQNGDCLVVVVAGVAVTLAATGEANEVFQSWSGPACVGQSATCTFTPLVATDVHAKFAKAH